MFRFLCGRNGTHDRLHGRPKYKRPAVNVRLHIAGRPPMPWGVATAGKSAAGRELRCKSLGDEKWWQVFQDPELQELIQTALKNNYDVRIAAARVLQAQAQVGHQPCRSVSVIKCRRQHHESAEPRAGPIPGYEITQG